MVMIRGDADAFPFLCYMKFCYNVVAVDKNRKAIFLRAPEQAVAFYPLTFFRRNTIIYG